MLVPSRRYPEEALLVARFTLSLPVTACLSPGHFELFRLLCSAAEHFTPLNAEEEIKVSRRSKGLAPLFYR